MKQEEIKIENGCFEYMGKTYSCEVATIFDTELILKEAEKSHPGYTELYNKETLRPDRIRVFIDERTEELVMGMIIYLIDYKDSKTSRTACGGYYPIYGDSLNCLSVHPYQYSICW